MRYLTKFATLIFLLPYWAFSSDVYPTTGKAVGLVVSEEPAGWVVLTNTFEPVPLILKDGNDTDGYKVCAFEGVAGTYGVFQFIKGKLQPTISKVILGPITPGPIPPNPDPPIPPNPPPVPNKDLWVIFVYESTQNLTKEQLTTLNSTKITQYLNEKCAKDSTNRPAWRKWDKDVDVSAEKAEWKDLWNHVKGSINTLPAMIVIKSGKATIYIVSDEETTLNLLKND